MRRLVAFLFLLACALSAAETPVIAVSAVDHPAPPNALGASLATGADGMVWLTWLESLADESTALRFARFDISTGAWTPAQTIASGRDWYVGGTDFPALAAGADGRATVAWFVKNPPSPATAHLHHGAGYHALVSSTADGGETWSAPARLSTESAANEFLSLVTLADGRVLAAWLDAREKIVHHKPQRLYARIIGNDEPDTLIDDSVCDCCHTTLTAFPDGGALLAYRGRSPEEVRDIHVARLRGGRWEMPRALFNDDWRIEGCPVNGPQLASDGGRVAATWFTAAEKQPRVVASFSPDAGARFLMPLRVDLGQPSGRVDTLLLRDGALLITWVETDGSFWLRRITPDFNLSEPLLLASPVDGRVKGFPRLALVRDYAGGGTTAEFLAVFNVDAPAGIRAVRVMVPEGALLAAEKNCDCAPTPEQLRGYPMRGTIAPGRPDGAAVRVKHPEVPGIFDAGTRTFRVAPALLETAANGRQFLGRIEQREGDWWLFDVRFLAAPPSGP